MDSKRLAEIADVMEDRGLTRVRPGLRTGLQGRLTP